MTKVTIIGKHEVGCFKPIEFDQYVNSYTGTICKASVKPSEYNNIELIKLSANGNDLMYAYMDDRNEGCLYLGKFNDGIIK